jgi:hypothetical protein
VTPRVIDLLEARWLARRQRKLSEIDAMRGQLGSDRDIQAFVKKECEALRKQEEEHQELKAHLKGFIVSG